MGLISLVNQSIFFTPRTERVSSDQCVPFGHVMETQELRYRPLTLYEMNTFDECVPS